MTSPQNQKSLEEFVLDLYSEMFPDAILDAESFLSLDENEKISFSKFFRTIASEVIRRHEAEKWVKCFIKDEVVDWPCVGTKVLALHSAGYQFEASIEEDSEDGVVYKAWHNWVNDEALFDDNVTYWQPLPAQPTKEQA